jgi:hypothetical protein
LTEEDEDSMTHFDPHDLGRPAHFPPSGNRPPLQNDDPVADLIATATELRDLWRFLILIAGLAALLIAVAP